MGEVEVMPTLRLMSLLDTDSLVPVWVVFFGMMAPSSRWCLIVLHDAGNGAPRRGGARSRSAPLLTLEYRVTFSFSLPDPSHAPGAAHGHDLTCG